MINFIEAKKNYILALAIMFVVVSLSGTTYSLFLKSDTTNTFNYNTGLLDLEFTEDEQIQLTKAFPINDSEGIKQKPYTLKIKNTGTLTYLFDLKMLSDGTDNNISTKYIKVKTNNELPHTLYTTNNVLLSNIIIFPGEELTFEINVWLDMDTPNAELGKTFSAKIVTTGQSIYKTLDSSGANHPELKDNMIPVYYDNYSKEWKKADKSNTISTYKWYNYDNQEWANSITINDTDKQIYDITGNYNKTVTSATFNNENLVIDNTPFDIGFANYNFNKMTTILRIKFNNIKADKIYIMTNKNITYYYDTQNKKFVLSNGSIQATSNNIEIEENKWYIIGYTYNLGQINFYIDGTKIGSSNINNNITSNNSYKLGTNKDEDIISKIIIGDIYLYNNILTDNDIYNNYKNSINIIYDNLILGYNNFTPMTKKEYYLSKPIGTTIELNDIEMFYVWIPRFKYKLWNVTGELGVSSYDIINQGIDVVFEQNLTSSGVIYCKDNTCYSDSLGITKVTQNDNGKYYTHPAFTNLDTQVTGLWVSKYELTADENECNSNSKQGCTTLDIKATSIPNTNIWTNNYLSNYYQVVKKINTNTNYHIIKNTEWGAISYLTHSKYGLCPNNKCQNAQNNNTYISGNEPKDSTTQNMTGVFDMFGSALEYTMANYADESLELSLANTNFKDIPISKSDYDLYYKDTFILGDATKELTLEGNTFIDSTNNWFIRGGMANIDSSSIFSYKSTTDINNIYISTRVVTK